LECLFCGQAQTGHVYCPNGHYVCDRCHGQDTFTLIRGLLLAAGGTDPVAVAEGIMQAAPLPMLGCEHAWIAAGALLVAMKNNGVIEVAGEQIDEALDRTRQQAIGAYCGLTGVCGVAVGVGAAFSVLLGAACPKDEPTKAVMQVVARVVEAIAREAGPCCCKNFVRTALTLSREMAKDYLGVGLACAGPVLCVDSHRHPHGCRKTRCRYYPGAG